MTDLTGTWGFKFGNPKLFFRYLWPQLIFSLRPVVIHGLFIFVVAADPIRRSCTPVWHHR